MRWILYALFLLLLFGLSLGNYGTEKKKDKTEIVVENHVIIIQELK